MSVTVNNNSSIQDYVHPYDQTHPTLEMIPGFKLLHRNFLLFISRLLIVHVNLYTQHFEIWVTTLLEEISSTDKFFTLLWVFVYSRETISIAVEPRYNEPLYNEVFGITNNFL